MRELVISLSVSTDLHEQEVVDMLIDGRIIHSGRITSIVVEDKKKRSSKTYDMKVELDAIS